MAPELLPEDEYNRTLLANAHPRDWVNPTAAPGGYDLVVIGGGTAGLVTAAGAAGLGARVALVERHLMGGDCLNHGCVPSKAMLRSARAVRELRMAPEFGVEAGGEPRVDFPRVMERMRRLRAEISPNDSAARFRSLGVDLFLGQGSFLSADRIAVPGGELRFRAAVIATGARARIPEVRGLEADAFLTNERVFSLTQLPARLAVLGGGPIGCEMAQCFARLGSRVTLFHAHAHLLEREDPEAAALLEGALTRDGIDLRLGAAVARGERIAGGYRLAAGQGGEPGGEPFDAILAAVGRRPNIEGLGLENAGVEFDARAGVRVNDWLRTTNPRVFACGDVCTGERFTHAADAMARIVIQNALFSGRRRMSCLVIPRCTYTDPELAQVGLTEKEALAAGVAVDRFVRPLCDVDRARLDGVGEGFVKVLVARGRDRILGATIVAPHAGEMISEVGVAIAGGVGLGRLASVIHPYPTVSDALRQCGDAYNRTRLSPWVRRLLQRWLEWRC
ncbi:MAG TPA: FAD-containing oxidoreductase [Verrucomicrobiales bacterium]|nr:FAD-containing oxidoreductase [Verrucomicrobiales bacterium]